MKASALAGKNHFEFIIIGAGILGLTVARSLLNRGFNDILILEKEAELGMHTSGRNSGVLHAGIYYASDSFKARFCSTGSKALQEYAAEKKIKCIKTGKVIVATTEEEHPRLLKLYEQAKKNSARVEILDEKSLKEIEPEAFTWSQALYSPDTAVIDIKDVLRNLADDLNVRGVKILKTKEAFQLESVGADVGNGAHRNRLLLKSGEEFSFGHLVNAAGLFADRLAHQLGVGLQYRILPFKGIYKQIAETAAHRFRGSIYPVPDPRFPFLGVHVTRGASGSVYLGPTAIPAIGRENYGIFSGLNPTETPQMLWNLGIMFARNSNGMRNLIFDELSKYSRAGFLKAVRKLAPNLQDHEIVESSKVGIRAQLINQEKMQLEMDFIVEKAPDSTHILNAISPAFTSSFPFADWVVEGIVGSTSNASGHAESRQV